METDLNSIIVTISYTITIFGIVSGLVVGHYYSKKASSKKKLTQLEFNRGVILVAITSFMAVAGIVGGNFIMDFLKPEPVSITGVIVTNVCLLGGLPLLVITTFTWEFRRKGWVEKND